MEMGKKYILSKKELQKIEEKATYNALKKLKEQQLKSDREQEEKKRDNISNLKYFIMFFLAPWFVGKHLKNNKRLYENVIVFFITFILELIGSVGWLAAIIGIFISAKDFLVTCEIKSMASAGLFFIILLISVLFIILGNRLSEEKDSKQIYTVATTIMAILTFMVAVVTLFFTI